MRVFPRQDDPQFCSTKSHLQLALGYHFSRTFIHTVSLGHEIELSVQLLPQQQSLDFPGPQTKNSLLARKINTDHVSHHH